MGMRPEWLSIAWLRFKALLSRRRLDRDLEDELRFHVAMREANLSHEMPAREASLEARKRFGNTSLWKEISRDMWTLGSLEIFAQDVRYALRSLRKTPGFTFVAILALAIGIGANTAIFSVANALALKSLPFRDPGKLVLLWGNVRRVKVERRGASYPDFVDWRKQSTSFEELAIYNSVGSTLVGADENLRIKCEQVSASYFPLLGISPLLGRTFLPSEDEVPMRDMVAILSEGLWKRRFGSDPAIIGKTIRTITRPYTVVGVVHASFPGISDEVEMWVPFMTSPSAAVEELPYWAG